MSALSEIKKQERETKNTFFPKQPMKLLHRHNAPRRCRMIIMTHWSSPNDYVIGRTPQMHENEECLCNPELL